MTLHLKFAAAAAGLVLAGAASAPAHAVDFLGVPLWESYPGQYRYTYEPVPPAPRWCYDPHTGRYYRQY